MPTAPDDDRWRLVWSHRDDLLRVARRRVPCAADAEDCVSEAMLRAALRDDLDDERAGAFLTAVTLRLCVDLHRRAARQPRVPEPAEASPEDVACDRAEAAWLAARLPTELTERERAAVARRAGLAHAWGGSAKAEATAVARARTKLRPLLLP